MEEWTELKNFESYRSCYAPTFVGTKDVPNAPPKRYDYAAWIADRRAMVKNFIDVEMEDVVYSVEGPTAIVSFRQTWRSLNHCDASRKTITIKMFPDGAKIIGERTYDAVNCYMPI